MTRARDVANVLSTATDLATDVETAAAVSAHNSASDPHGDRAAATTAISNHSSANDPHGDRAFAIGKSTLTTTGDILYASSANTPTRLGIGSSGQVLAVSAGIPAWTAPSAGFAPQLVQIATGTLSGSSVTISSLSSYDNLYIRIIDACGVTNANGIQCYLRINNNSTTNYERWGYGTIGTGAPLKINFTGASFIPFNSLELLPRANESPSSVFHISLENLKQAKMTNGYVSSFYKRGDGIFSQEEQHFIYKVDETVSSIVLGSDNGNFGGGTYTVWGS